MNAMSASGPSTSMTNDSPHRIGELRTLYDKADQFAREVAELEDEIAIPAINELRYAGYHLLQAIGDDGTISKDEQLRRATSHCERAMYEAAEAGINLVLVSIDQFREDYKNIVVKDVVDDYASIIVQARKAQDLLARGRSDQISSSERASCYMETFRQLRDASEMLEASRDDLNAKLSEQVKDKRRFIIRCLLILFGTVVAASGIMISM